MAELLLIKDVVLDNKVKLPNVKAFAGDVLWVETENSLYADVFISLLLGLLKPKKGTIKFFNSNSSYCDITEWVPQVKDPLSLVRTYSYAKGLQISSSTNNLKRILDGVNLGYLSEMEIKEMAKSSKALVSWAVSLSVPALNIILNDPYYGLDKNSCKFLAKEIDEVAKDGSLVIIMSQEQPMIFTQHISFMAGKNK